MNQQEAVQILQAKLTLRFLSMKATRYLGVKHTNAHRQYGLVAGADR